MNLMRTWVGLVLCAVVILGDGCTKVTRNQLDEVGESESLTLEDHQLVGSKPVASQLTPVSCVIKTVQGVYWSASKIKSFNFECLDGESQSIKEVQCQLNQQEWIPCQSATEHRLQNLPNGQHQFRVKGTKKNEDGSVQVGFSAFALWGVDGEAPRVLSVTNTLSSQSQDPWRPVFHFSGEEPQGVQSGIDRFECRLSKDQTTWRDCVSPYQFEALPMSLQGSIRMDVKVVDRAGNRSAMKSVLVTLPKSPSIPSGICLIKKAPPAWSPLKNVSIPYECFGEHLSDPATVVECRMDQGEWNTCSAVGNYLATGLSEGEHFFEVRYRVGQGWMSPAQGVRWGVDTTPPQVVFTEINTDGQNAIFGFQAMDQSGVGQSWCRHSEENQEWKPWVVCQSPVNLSSGLIPGKTYLLQIKAKDLVGNESIPTETRWTVEPGVKPSCQWVTQIPQGRSRESSLPIQFACSSPVAIVKTECRLDGREWTDCQSPSTHQISGLVDGPHTFSVRATDSFGNVGEATPELLWVTDLTPPQLQWVSQGFDHPTARLDFLATDPGAALGPVSTQCIVQGEGQSPIHYHPCPSPLVVSGLTLDKSYQVTVIARDSVGNESTPLVAQWVSTPRDPAPVCSLVRPASLGATSSELQQTFEIVCNGVPAQTYQCQSGSGSTWGPCQFPYTLVVPQPQQEGVRCFSARGVDQWGRVGPSDQICWSQVVALPLANFSIKRHFCRGPYPISPNLRDSIHFHFYPTGSYGEPYGSSGSCWSSPSWMRGPYQCRLESDFTPERFPGLKQDLVDQNWKQCWSSFAVTGDPQVGRLPGVTYTFRVKVRDSSGRDVAESTYQWTNGAWTHWSDCSASGCGTRGSRSRSCSAPSPSIPYGLGCYGSKSESCVRTCE